MSKERYVYYIDVGNLPKEKAQQYVNEIMNKWKESNDLLPDEGLWFVPVSGEGAETRIEKIS